MRADESEPLRKSLSLVADKKYSPKVCGILATPCDAAQTWRAMSLRSGRLISHDGSCDSRVITKITLSRGLDTSCVSRVRQSFDIIPSSMGIRLR